MKKSVIESAIKVLKFPENFSEYRVIKPSKITINAMARLKCQQCGLIARAILCPPYLAKTYKQFATIESCRDWVYGKRYAIVMVWKNDGTKSWKLRLGDLKHIDFKLKKGMQLKGTEVAQSKEIGRLMYLYKSKLDRQLGVRVFGLLNGHCDRCRGRKCPNRDNPPCKKGGMPSLEAIGIDVYKLLEDLNIEYEYPVVSYVTAVTMFLV